MKKSFIIIVLSILYLSGAAQSDQFNLQLSTVNVELKANYSDASYIKARKSELFKGYYYRYIQFTTLPTNEQKEQLEKKGIRLMMYLPSNTYMAAIRSGTSLKGLNYYNIRGIHEVKAQYKLLNELDVAIKENVFPGYSVKEDKIGIGFTYYENISHESIKKYLKAKKLEVSFEDVTTRWFVAWVKKSEILKFVGSPFVCSAELVDDVPQPDNNVGRTSIRSNVACTDYSGGRKYNGNGIKVMLQDDGIIGPHIDYKGRLPMQFITSNSGDHGDHCAGIIMAAGNKNPLTRGMAWGSDIYVYAASPSYQGFDSITNHYNSFGIRIISTSYSDGCNAGYTTRAQQLDIQCQNMPQLIHVFSAGNMGTSNCSYGAGAGWGNVTGGHKHSKNSIAVANLDYLDVRNSSSSRGPAHDGRLKPEVSAVGTNVYSTSNPNNYVYKTGTSMSCPGIAGLFAQLYQAYKDLNSNVTPPSALIKAIVMNTADDLGNPGPDFGYGYGRANGLRAVQTIEQAKYLSGSIINGGLNTHNITIPAGVRQVKVMTYWHDYQASVNAAVALVNNLNTDMVTPSSSTINPLILDYTPNATNLNNPAVPGIDIRNNHEQIVINNPTAGNYVLRVNGTSVPQGPQTYYVTWIFYYDGYTVTYPIGAEGFVPGETETIRWNTEETVGNQTLQYTTDNEATWNTISTTIPGTQRYFNWVVPNALSGQCKVRISRGAYSAKSDTMFSIIPLPSNINVNWACPDSVNLTWTAAAGATSYDIFKLGAMYMDSVGTSVTNSFVITNVPSAQTHWFSVRARGPLNAVGRRAIAIEKTPGTFGCTAVNDAACNSVINPAGTYPDCQNLTAIPITVNIYNAGNTNITGIPMFYRINGGPIVNDNYTGSIPPAGNFAFTFTTTANINTAGTYNIKAWSNYSGDLNTTNDTSYATILVASVPNSNLPLTENFESFSLCSTASTCSLSCALGNGFTNESNTLSDTHDWRVHEGSTPSANTGPDFDYNPGTITGNYAYLEADGPCTNLTAKMLSPCLDLSTMSNPMLTFGYHMYGVNTGTLYVDLLSNGTWTNNVWSMSGDKGNSWLMANINLSAWSTQKINVRWRGVTGSGVLTDIAIDGIGVQSTTGINEITTLQGVKLFPNPSEGIFTLQLSDLDGKELSYTIVDVSGRKVKQHSAGSKSGEFNTTIDIKDFASGLYTLVLQRGVLTDYIKLGKF